jgi:hypothetical protein
LELLADSDPMVVAEALYSATYHDADWKWVQGLCLQFLKSDHVPIRWAAATCLGDLATFHKRLDLDLVIPALREASSDPAIRAPAEDSLSFVKQFVKMQ